MSVFATAFEPYGPGRKAGIDALLPSSLKAKMVAYKKNVAKRYRICSPAQIDERIQAGNLFISAKVDGELWFLCKLQGEVAVCNPRGRVVMGIPLTDEAERHLASAGDMMVAGELFAVVKGARTRVKDVARAMGDGALAPTLGFKVFDIVSEGEEDSQRKPYAERWARITELFKEGKRVAPVLTVEGQVDAVHARFEEWVMSGTFEGLVVRGENMTYKVKNTIDIDVVVLGFGEHRTAEGAEVREIIVGLLRTDGAFHVLGTVGSGLTPADRIAWMKRLEPMVVESAFRMANSEGTLCRWVRPEIVIQLRVSDLLDSDSRDAPIRRMVLQYDEKGWTPTGTADFVSLLFPVFDRERPDKPVDPAYVGVEQVLAVLPVESGDVETAAAAPASVVVKRRVWTKAGKGGTAVRKALVIQTNKDGEEFPPFVAWFTDYSGGRKEPLQTQLRVAATREHIDAITDAWIVDNVKKGWVEL